MFKIAKDKGFEVFQIEVKKQNHVHIFASAHPKIAPSYIAKMVKAIIGRKLMLEFSGLKKVF